MDVTKIKAALAAVKTEINNAKVVQQKTLKDDNAKIEALEAAGNAIRVLGRINSAVTKAETKIETALKKLEPKAKREKKAKGGADKK